MRKLYTAIVLTTLTFILATAFTLFLNDDLYAIPAFARKYNMSCTTCHAPFPSLKDYGDEFAGNGFVLKDKDAPRYFVDTGDRNLSLIRDFPIAVRLEGHLQYNSETEQDIDFTSPYLVKLLSGGSLTTNLAYYFYFYMNERGEVAGVEDAFLMFNDLFNSELDLYVGQFQVSDPLFKRELRLPLEDYHIYTVRPGSSQINLAYDRGIMLTYGFESGTDVIVEIVNGNGLSEAGSFRVYDDDKYKCFVGRISQDVGEYLRLGGFGYYGKEGEPNTNEVWFIGPDATIALEKVTLNLQFIERRDDNPEFTVAGENDDIKLETRGGFAELIYWPEGDRSRWYAAGLFNWVESDQTDLKYRSVAGHVGHMLRTNLRLVGEIRYDLETEETRLSTGFIIGI